MNGCSFAIINVSRNRNCVTKSQQTNTPLRYVPFIVLYVDSKPFMIYKGEYTREHILRFILDVSKNIQNKRKFASGKVSHAKSIPSYTIGHPICGDDNVCYLEFLQAYPFAAPNQ